MGRHDREIARVARRMPASGLVVGSVGNVSARRRDGLLITPTRRDHATLRRRDLVSVGFDGRVRAGRHAPSSELALHLAVYLARPDVGAVIHTHSPYATAWSFRQAALEPATEEIAYYDIGEIQTSEPARAGSPELAAAGVAALGPRRAALLGGHGVLAVGTTPGEALTIAAAVEHQAHVAWLCASAGVLQPDG